MVNNGDCNEASINNLKQQKVKTVFLHLHPNTPEGTRADTEVDVVLLLRLVCLFAPKNDGFEL